MTSRWLREQALRWMKFNLVGATGILVQLGVLATLKSIAGLDYLAATALAVEAALLQNFIWHQRWTWSDRPNGNGWRSAAGRLLRFNFTTGGVSIVSNLLVMRLLVGGLGLPYLPANLIAIAVTSVANFLLADRLVFLPESNVRVKLPPVPPAAR